MVELSGVSLGYGNYAVLRGVSFKISRDDFFLIQGPNGAGKSTLGQSMLGFIKPQAGDFNAAYRRPAYVPQQRYLDMQYPLSLVELVETGLKPGPFYHSISPQKRKERRKAAVEALDRVGMSANAGLLFREASGGQLQRTLIARALISQPDFIILDEPFSNLDFAGKASIADLLQEKSDEGMTIGIIDHTSEIDDKLQFNCKLRVEAGSVRFS